MKTTLSALGAAAPAPLDSAPLASLASDDQALEDFTAAAQRLSDATAYLELVGGPGHALLAVEYRAFVAQETDMQAALAAARERLLPDVAGAEAVSAALPPRWRLCWSTLTRSCLECRPPGNMCARWRKRWLRPQQPCGPRWRRPRAGPLQSGGRPTARPTGGSR